MTDGAPEGCQIAHPAPTRAPNAEISSSTRSRPCYRANPLGRILLPLLLTCAAWLGTSAEALDGLDVLGGTAGERPICSLTPPDATTLFGIPSRNLAAPDGFTMEFSHHGLVLEFSESSERGRLGALTVYAVDREGFVGYRGHFLGTVANGTRSDPVRRLLRLARADIARDDAELVHARLDGYELEIGFVYDMIDWARLVCAPSGARGTEA